MFKQLLALCAVAGALSACSSSGSNSAEVRAQKAKYLALWDTRQTVSHAGRPFELAISADRSFAFIAPAASGFSYTPLDLEAAAKAGTGCSAKYSSGILEFLGGYSETVDLRPIQGKAKDFKYWRTDLTC